jgi:hypothetical protein
MSGEVAVISKGEPTVVGLCFEHLHVKYRAVH